MKPEDFPVPLPEGWICESWGDGLALTVPSCGSVTIDFVARCFRGGLTTIGRSSSEAKYEGHTWRARLCLDAIKWLQVVHDKRKR